MSEEEEIDYMSDDFIFACTKNDIRPGLINNQIVKKKIEAEKRKAVSDDKYRKKVKPIKEIQEERLKEGLDTAIDTSNKGFSMLQKMGYKPGTSLGKQGQGRLEPVNVIVKTDRIGLGWQEILKHKRQIHEERRLLRKQKREELCDPTQYRARMSSLHQEKKMLADLSKSQKMCYNFDSREGILTPHVSWFWPSYALDEEEDKEEEEEDSCLEENIAGESKEETENDEEDIFEPSEQLEVITSYLRSNYFYCIWCSASYDGDDDLSTNCPGSTRVDHND